MQMRQQMQGAGRRLFQHLGGRSYNYSDMKVKVDEQNYVVFNPQIGGRIIELRLAGKQIIKGQYHGLDNSSYLMFPWVNRIEKVPFDLQHPYTDDNGLPIHGLYVDSPRQTTVFTINSDSVGIEMTPEVKYEDIPAFTETIVLSKGKFSQKIKVHNTVEHKLPFCFGYHPYLQIDQENIADLLVKTDIKTNITLDKVRTWLILEIGDDVPIGEEGDSSGGQWEVR